MKDWHRHNTEELGMSKRASYRTISKQYGCSWENCRYWLEPKVRASSIRRRKSSRVSYSEDPRVEERRIHSRIYQDIRRNIPHFLLEVYCGRDTALSLDEITLNLARHTNIELRNSTLLKVVAAYEKKHTTKILEENGNHQPPRYRLVNQKQYS
jgi:hypothetical protein